MKKFLSLSIITLIIIIITITYLSFSKKEKQKKIETPKTIELNNPQKLTPLSAPQPLQSEVPQNYNLTPLFVVNKSYQEILNRPLLYLDLDYPFLYVYNPIREVIESINLIEGSNKELIKISNVKNALISENKTKIFIDTETNVSLLDLKSDQLYKLPISTKNIIFNSQIILYLNNDKNNSYLAYFKNNKITKIRDLAILQPNFEKFKNGLLIYETNNSGVFFINPDEPNSLELFLEPKSEYSLLTNKTKDLILVSFKENGHWQSQIIDSNKQNKFSFTWGTIKNKCSFEELLICAIPADLQNFSIDDWLSLKSYYDQKIIIYDPRDNGIKEITLEDKFDFIKPKLTPLGIITWNRLDGKFYLIKFNQ